MENEKLEMDSLPNRVICMGCENEIDEEVCCCGDLIRPGYGHDNHNPVPLGCTCGYLN